MAISYQEVKSKYEEEMNASLSERELDTIKKTELEIDDIIRKSFKDEPIDININSVLFLQFPRRRAALMRKELENRYENAGWKVSTYETEDDGPNRPGYTYWRLKGGKF